MMFTVKLTKKAKKQLSKIQKQDQSRIIANLYRIAYRPHQFTSKMVSLQLSKLRVGSFRILMKIQDQELIILVIEIDKRDKICKDKS